jgi:hypothetical protein
MTPSENRILGNANYFYLFCVLFFGNSPPHFGNCEIVCIKTQQLIFSLKNSPHPHFSAAKLHQNNLFQLILPSLIYSYWGAWGFYIFFIAIINSIFILFSQILW